MKGYCRLSQIVLSFSLVFTLACAPAGAAGVNPSPATDKHSQPRIVINIPSRTLWLYQGDRIVRYYSVGVGRPGFPTPVGKHKVLRKVVNPAWENPYKPAGAIRIRAGANNPLGTRWIGFKQYKGGEYGIHGTDNPGSVGKFSSHGCVRMRVKEAEDLFSRVQVDTPVEVVYETVLIRPQGEKMRLVVFPDVFQRGMPSVAEVRKKILKQYPHALVQDELIRLALERPNEKPVVVGALTNTDKLSKEKKEDKKDDSSGDDDDEDENDTLARGQRSLLKPLQWLFNSGDNVGQAEQPL